MRRNYLFIVLTITLVLNFMSFDMVNAEEKKIGKCAITITTDHTSSKMANSTGPCAGFMFGYHHYQGGNRFFLDGYALLEVKNGEKVMLSLPPTAGDYYEYEMTVTTVVKDQAKPEPKPDPKPEPKPDPKPQPKPDKSNEQKPKQEQPKQTKPVQTKPAESKPTTDKSVAVEHKEKPSQKVSNEVPEDKSNSNDEKVEREKTKEEPEEVQETAEEESEKVEEVDAASQEELASDEATTTETKESISILMPILIGVLVVALLSIIGLYYFHPTVREAVDRFLKKLFKRK